MYKLRVLICDDMDHVRLAHDHRIRQVGSNLFFPEIEQTSTAEEAVRLVASASREGSPFDLVLMDVDFSQSPESSGLDGFTAANKIREISSKTVTVMISAYDSESNLRLAERSPWVERYFRRDSFQKTELLEVCTFALVRKLHDKDMLLSPSETIYTRASVMQEYLRKVDHISHTQNVVIFGETGTGKELTAKRINVNAQIALGQKSRPLVSINCGGLTESLRGSELFGYCAGAFTGANRDTPGLLEQAQGGDVFLDELQNAPISLQDMLMRVLNNKEFTPVGGKSVKKLDVRFISALNQDPVTATQEGRLKPDLLPRLQQSYLVIPPLRERREDFSYLIERFFQINPSADKSFSLEAVEFLREQRWPTNVRGLNNVLSEAIQQTKIPVIAVDALRALKSVQDMLVFAEAHIITEKPPELNPKMDELASAWLRSDLSLEDILKGVERALLAKLREQERTSIGIARRAKMPETTVRRKLAEYQLS